MAQIIGSVSQGVLKTDAGIAIAVDSLQWQQWVTENNSFRYESKSGSSAYTVRREKSTRGAKEYWYGYRKFQGKLHKRYIGRTEDLTLSKLEEMGEALNTVIEGRVTDTAKSTVETTVTDKKNEQVEELQIQLNELQIQVALLQQQLEIAQHQQRELTTASKEAVTDELQIKRDRVLNRLKVGRQSSVGKALDAFIKEISRGVT